MAVADDLERQRAALTMIHAEPFNALLLSVGDQSLQLLILEVPGARVASPPGVEALPGHGGHGAQPGDLALCAFRRVLLDPAARRSLLRGIRSREF